MLAKLESEDYSLHRYASWFLIASMLLVGSNVGTDSQTVYIDNSPVSLSLATPGDAAGQPAAGRHATAPYRRHDQPPTGGPGTAAQPI